MKKHVDLQFHVHSTELSSGLFAFELFGVDPIKKDKVLVAYSCFPDNRKETIEAWSSVEANRFIGLVFGDKINSQTTHFHGDDAEDQAKKFVRESTGH